jgi:2-keto-4-pentenoate hydratase/2-oxohepta-3-ene-1,7-dioic acid hydratase in catechol pathway
VPPPHARGCSPSSHHDHRPGGGDVRPTRRTHSRAKWSPDGKKAHDAEAEAKQYVFGVTAGNDVSERDWQKADLQWFRAKGTDTFGPLGPVIATGLNYDDLLVQTRLNGEVKQSQRTTDLIFNVAAIVSYVSRYVTLMPGDVIYTGTPGTTSAMKPGDVVEVEVEGVGVLRNTIAAARRQ